MLEGCWMLIRYWEQIPDFETCSSCGRRRPSDKLKTFNVENDSGMHREWFCGDSEACAASLLVSTIREEME